MTWSVLPYESKNGKWSRFVVKNQRKSDAVCLKRGKIMANLQRTKENLEALGYEVTLCETIDQANQVITTQLQGKTVGIGGSMTVKEMGLYPLLQAHNEVIWAWEGGDTKEATRCQVYLSSVNGIAETGELVNIDGLGNRVSATIYGTEEVIFIVSVNKIEETLEKAIYRARNIASPKNAQRLNRNTPCGTKGDTCYNCRSPERICRSMVVHLYPPGGSRSQVVLINETLGY